MPRLPSALVAIGCAALASLCLASCAGEPAGSALIWTDVPELAIAVELFDAREGPGTVRLAWKSDPAGSLLSAEGGSAPSERPALLVGRRLRSASLRDRLSSLEYLLERGGIGRDSFYPELLEGGVVEGKRALLPVSFNLPAIAFLRDSRVGGDGFTLSLPEIAAPSAAYRRPEAGAKARMGFSPRWNARFLLAALDSGGARFREGKGPGGSRLDWDASGLPSALSELASWSRRVNLSAALEDDYSFKYLFSPPRRWLEDGRALFAYMDSSELFLAGEEKRAELDFRWFAIGGTVPFSEGAVYAGLVRGSPGRAQAESFLRWLFTSEAQRAILERSREVRASSYSFGVAGGFSSVRSVNEAIFPAFYPALVGHAPPADRLAAPALVPEDWPELEASVLEPWALDATSRIASAPQADAGGALAASAQDLAARIADFRRRESRPSLSRRASARRAPRIPPACRP